MYIHTLCIIIYNINAICPKEVVCFLIFLAPEEKALKVQCTDMAKPFAWPLLSDSVIHLCRCHRTARLFLKQFEQCCSITPLSRFQFGAPRRPVEFNLLLDVVPTPSRIALKNPLLREKTVWSLSLAGFLLVSGLLWEQSRVTKREIAGPAGVRRWCHHLWMSGSHLTVAQLHSAKGSWIRVRVCIGSARTR